jgi:hypothetical protein
MVLKKLNKTSILYNILVLLKGYQMAQLSLYLDSETMKKLEKMARVNKVSVSKWVREKLKGTLTDAWPKDYFNLYGSVNHDSFKKPETLPFMNDFRREHL